MATCSSLDPSGELTQSPALLSIVEASQSAASAAGVVPPVTKWKKRGPVEFVAASSRFWGAARGKLIDLGEVVPVSARSHPRQEVVERFAIHERIGHTVIIAPGGRGLMRPVGAFGGRCCAAPPHTAALEPVRAVRMSAGESASCRPRG